MAAGVTPTDVPSTVNVRSDAVAGVATSAATRWTSARLTSGLVVVAGSDTGVPSSR